MTEHHDSIAQLRDILHRDIDEASTSIIPPGAIIGMLMDDEDAGIEVYRITYGHLLRRLMRGMALDDVVSLGKSYLGMQPVGILRQLTDMRRVCGYADGILAKSISRDDALAQMMTWKNADQRLITGLLDETLDIYRRENRTAYTPPEPDLLLPDGEIRNNSFSTSAPHVQLQFLRLLRYDPDIGGMVRMFGGMAVVGLVLLLGDIALFWRGHWIWGLLLLPLILFCSKFGLLLRHVPRIAESIRHLYQDALLTPGIIEQVEPLTILCLASMKNDSGPDYWGLKRRQISGLPFHAVRRGEVFPCVSGFQDGDADGHWVDFTPRPIAWGTTDALKIKDLMVKLDRDEVEHLKRLLKQGPLPKDMDKILILDAQFAPLRPT